MAESNPPSEERLKLMIANGCEAVAKTQIEYYNMPYDIVNGVLVDKLGATQRWLNKFITDDAATKEMLADVIKLAKCPDEILITGDTGTGKETIARAMIGDRKGGFQAVNCAGFPETLIESILFGYVKGAFTGAENQRRGVFAAAENGVVFLDEVGELPLPMQAKLLRALQDKKITKLGATVEEDINCKFVCATNRNIKEMVEKGEFRRDLYARISTFELHIKPLAERRSDVELILASLEGGAKFIAALHAAGKKVHDLDISLNVRGLQQYVKRFNVLGRIVL